MDMVLLTYFAGLALLVGAQVLFARRNGWKGVLATVLSELVLIIGGGSFGYGGPETGALLIQQRSLWRMCADKRKG
jgi:hypothetical protein